MEEETQKKAETEKQDESEKESGEMHEQPDPVETISKGKEKENPESLEDYNVEELLTSEQRDYVLSLQHKLDDTSDSQDIRSEQNEFEYTDTEFTEDTQTTGDYYDRLFGKDERIWEEEVTYDQEFEKYLQEKKQVSKGNRVKLRFKYEIKESEIRLVSDLDNMMNEIEVDRVDTPVKNGWYQEKEVIVNLEFLVDEKMRATMDKRMILQAISRIVDRFRLSYSFKNITSMMRVIHPGINRFLALFLREAYTMNTLLENYNLSLMGSAEYNLGSIERGVKSIIDVCFGQVNQSQGITNMQRFVILQMLRLISYTNDSYELLAIIEKMEINDIDTNEEISKHYDIIKDSLKNRVINYDKDVIKNNCEEAIKNMIGATSNLIINKDSNKFVIIPKLKVTKVSYRRLHTNEIVEYIKWFFYNNKEQMQLSIDNIDKSYEQFGQVDTELEYFINLNYIIRESSKSQHFVEEALSDYKAEATKFIETMIIIVISYSKLDRYKNLLNDMYSEATRASKLFDSIKDLNEFTKATLNIWTSTIERIKKTMIIIISSVRRILDTYQVEYRIELHGVIRSIANEMHDSDKKVESLLNALMKLNPRAATEVFDLSNRIRLIAMTQDQNDRVAVVSNIGNTATTIVTIDKPLPEMPVGSSMQRYLKALLEISDYIIFDISNMQKAMKLSIAQINQLALLFSAAGFLIMGVKDEADKSDYQLATISYMMKGAHDDLLLLQQAAFNKAIIISKDTFQEFFMGLYLCKTHKLYVYRKQTKCKYDNEGQCRYELIGYSNMKRTYFEKVNIVNGSLTSIVVPKKWVLNMYDENPKFTMVIKMPHKTIEYLSSRSTEVHKLSIKGEYISQISNKKLQEPIGLGNSVIAQIGLSGVTKMAVARKEVEALTTLMVTLNHSELTKIKGEVEMQLLVTEDKAFISSKYDQNNKLDVMTTFDVADTLLMSPVIMLGADKNVREVISNEKQDQIKRNKIHYLRLLLTETLIDYNLILVKINGMWEFMEFTDMSWHNLFGRELQRYAMSSTKDWMTRVPVPRAFKKNLRYKALSYYGDNYNKAASSSIVKDITTTFIIDHEQYDKEKEYIPLIGLLGHQGLTEDAEIVHKVLDQEYILQPEQIRGKMLRRFFLSESTIRFNGECLSDMAQQAMSGADIFIHKADTKAKATIYKMLPDVANSVIDSLIGFVSDHQTMVTNDLAAMMSEKLGLTQGTRTFPRIIISDTFPRDFWEGENTVITVNWQVAVGYSSIKLTISDEDILLVAYCAISGGPAYALNHLLRGDKFSWTFEESEIMTDDIINQAIDYAYGVAMMDDQEMLVIKNKNQKLMIKKTSYFVMEDVASLYFAYCSMAPLFADLVNEDEVGLAISGLLLEILERPKMVGRYNLLEYKPRPSNLFDMINPAEIKKQTVMTMKGEQECELISHLAMLDEYELIKAVTAFNARYPQGLIDDMLLRHKTCYQVRDKLYKPNLPRFAAIKRKFESYRKTRIGLCKHHGNITYVHSHLKQGSLRRRNNELMFTAETVQSVLTIDVDKMNVKVIEREKSMIYEVCKNVLPPNTSKVTIIMILTDYETVRLDNQIRIIRENYKLGQLFTVDFRKLISDRTKEQEEKTRNIQAEIRSVFISALKTTENPVVVATDKAGPLLTQHLKGMADIRTPPGLQVYIPDRLLYQKIKFSFKMDHLMIMSQPEDDGQPERSQESEDVPRRTLPKPSRERREPAKLRYSNRQIGIALLAILLVVVLVSYTWVYAKWLVFFPWLLTTRWFSVTKAGYFGTILVVGKFGKFLALTLQAAWLMLCALGVMYVNEEVLKEEP